MYKNLLLAASLIIMLPFLTAGACDKTGSTNDHGKTSEKTKTDGNGGEDSGEDVGGEKGKSLSGGELLKKFQSEDRVYSFDANKYSLDQSVLNLINAWCAGSDEKFNPELKANPATEVVSIKFNKSATAGIISCSGTKGTFGFNYTGLPKENGLFIKLKEQFYLASIKQDSVNIGNEDYTVTELLKAMPWHVSTDLTKLSTAVARLATFNSLNGTAVLPESTATEELSKKSIADGGIRFLNFEASK